MPESISHIQIYQTIGYMRDWFTGLEEHYQTLLYDGRGQGMSSRGLNADHSIEDEVSDLEAVLEAAGLERVVLLARTPAGVRFAARQPERVEALVLQALPVAGSAWPNHWSLGLASENWDLFLEMLASMPMPAAIDRAESVQRLKRVVNQDDWLLRARVLSQADITTELRSLSVPTLVLHPRDYHVIPIEESIKVASVVPGARLVLVDGTTSRGDAQQCVRAIDDFVGSFTAAGPGTWPTKGVKADVALSPRQDEVLKLIAAGKTTREIAEALVVSERTVERHIAETYAKIGARNRAEATAYVLSRLST
jgi:pimeloyl-ACP methyl ester carboxylesterase/DNA-binding CsgD family transcriptional regulator